MSDIYWTVMRTRGHEIEERNSFVNEDEARVAANQLVGKEGWLVVLARSKRNEGALHVEVNNVPGAFTHPFNRPPA